MRLSHRIPSLRKLLTLSVLVVGAFCVAAPVSSASAAKRADLSITSNKLSSTSIVRGSNLTSTIKVKNKGKKSSAKSVAGFWISYDGKYSSGDVLAGSAKVAKLAPGKSREAKLTIQIPVDFPAGTFYMVACADGDKKIKESSEKNNCRAAKVSITEPTGPVGPPTPPDADSDGVPDSSDNCPAVANPDQSDADADGKGDVCDSCPSDSNPADAGCPATVYEVRNDDIQVGEKVVVSNITVTGASGNRAFGQLKSGDPGYTIAENSGLTMNFAGSTTLVPGDVVRVTGTVNASHTLDVSGTEIVGTGAAPPSPYVITAAQLVSNTASYDALLVQISNAGCSTTCNSGDAFWDLESGSTGFRVFSTLTSLPAKTFPLLSVTGIGTKVGGSAGLMPRDGSDMFELPVPD